MSEERDRLERAKAKMNELTLGREYDAAWRAVLSALEAAGAEVAALRAEALRHAADDRAVIADLRAEVERLKAEVAALREQAAGAEGLRKSMYALEARVDKLRAERDELKRQLVVAEAAEARVKELEALPDDMGGALGRAIRMLRESRAREARLEMALRGQATRLLPDGGVCYCDIQRSDECRNEPPCVEARAALASGESREGETCWLIEAPAGAWGWQSVHWWCGQQEGGAEWTADATIAVRFLRREDAEAVLNFLTDQLIEVGGGVRVTEHVFLRRALASGESREEATIKESLIVHPFTPCLLEGIEPGHNFTCGLLCTVCGLPEDKHPASAGPAEEPGRETR